MSRRSIIPPPAFNTFNAFAKFVHVYLIKVGPLHRKAAAATQSLWAWPHYKPDQWSEIVRTRSFCTEREGGTVGIEFIKAGK